LDPPGSVGNDFESRVQIPEPVRKRSRSAATLPKIFFFLTPGNKEKVRCNSGNETYRACEKVEAVGKSATPVSFTCIAVPTFVKSYTGIDIRIQHFLYEFFNQLCF
jgi:hypothetical protein